mgnify:CR=1 FL=1
MIREFEKEDLKKVEEGIDTDTQEKEFKMKWLSLIHISEPTRH